MLKINHHPNIQSYFSQINPNNSEAEITRFIHSPKNIIGQQTLAAVVAVVESLAEDTNAKAVDLGEEILTKGIMNY